MLPVRFSLSDKKSGPGILAGNGVPLTEGPL